MNITENGALTKIIIWWNDTNVLTGIRFVEYKNSDKITLLLHSLLFFLLNYFISLMFARANKYFLDSVS